MSTRRVSQEVNRYDSNLNGDEETVLKVVSVAAKPEVDGRPQSRRTKCNKQSKSASSSAADLHQPIAGDVAGIFAGGKNKKSPRSSSEHPSLGISALKDDLKPNSIRSKEDAKVSRSKAVASESEGEHVKALDSWGGVFRKPKDAPSKPANRRSRRDVKNTENNNKSKFASADNLLQTEIVKATNNSETEGKKLSPGSNVRVKGSTAAEKRSDEKPNDLTETIANEHAMKTSLTVESRGTGEKSTQRNTQPGGARRSKSSASTQRSVKGRKSALNQLSSAADFALNRQITDFFPVVRRSDRRTTKQIDEERREVLELLVEDFQSRESSCFKVVFFSEKGRGVVTARNFERGDFVVEYAGELIDENEAHRREELYSRDNSIGCYVYYFMAGSRRFCIDATRETGRIGRLINHSRKEANLVTRCVNVPFGDSGTPRLLFFAKRDIAVGEELLYDYGDRSRSVLESHPWLKI